MNKLLALSTIAGALLFSGCGKTTAFDFFSTDTYYEKSISNMQKASLMRDMETKALLHAVYLNNVDPALYNGDEYFYVAVHIIEDAYDPKKHGLKNLDYNLKMIVPKSETNIDDAEKQPEFDKEKGSPFSSEEDAFEGDLSADAQRQDVAYIEAVEITELDENDKLRRTMPVRNQWNHFYLVRFPANESSEIRLTFENDRYGTAQLTFQKVK